ncbi:hypothetical protein DMUE_5739 [Dictyocoela muelleri]|nr:hypothetical protein DMUE_5739 [Dictyocoela muelleri]
MRELKQKRNTYTLRDKRKIALAYKNNHKTVKELEDEFKVSKKVVRTSLDLTNELCNLDSDDPILDHNNINNSKVKNLVNIDQYILEWIRKIRNLGGNVLKGNIQSLAQRYIDKTLSCKVKVTPYFFRSFKKGII